MKNVNLVLERFLGAIHSDAENLQEKEGDEINPTGKKVIGDSAFKDNCTYIYSLSSLHSVLKSFASFDNSISERREQKEDKSENQWREDLKRLTDLPYKVAFDLRGYIGAFSEENMILEANKLRELRDILKNWSYSNMNSGIIQDELYQLLWDYASMLFVGDNEGEKEKGIIKERVDREIRAFKEVLEVSYTIAWDIFNSVWDGYEAVLQVQKEEKVNQKEYIDRIVDEKLQLMEEVFATEVKEIQAFFEANNKELLQLINEKQMAIELINDELFSMKEKYGLGIEEVPELEEDISIREDFKRLFNLLTNNGNSPGCALLFAAFSVIIICAVYFVVRLTMVFYGWRL